VFTYPGLALVLAAAVGPSGGPPARRGDAARAVRPVERPGDAQVVPAAEGDVQAELAQTEAMHRAVVRGPIDTWWLEPVKARYQALLPRAGDSAAAVIRERLATVARQETIARDALAFESVLQRSRQRDGRVALVRRRLASVKQPVPASFDAEGVMQPSARTIGGEKALALIGPDGFAVAYLRVPPGLDTRPLLTRRVGVRGEVHYDDRLHARVIAVSDVEALERPR
jgi:hypothetical protein